jgi:hypothetical protein
VERTGTSQVSKEVFASMRKGDAALILYDPVKPGRSKLYEASDYQAVI